MITLLKSPDLLKSHKSLFAQPNIEDRRRKNRNGGVNIAKVHVANYTETKKIVIE